MSAPRPILPGHLAVTASAGSGKTYHLTARMIGLLSAGARPERIVALTFTRKSAGEIFRRVVTRLAQAVLKPDDLAALNESLPDWAPRLNSDRARLLLRDLLDAMPRLSIGTLDSFFYRIARSFCFELGLPPDVEILDGHIAEEVRIAALDRMFSPGRDAIERKRLAEAVKQASFGLERKTVYSTVQELVGSHQEAYNRAPDADVWGNPLRIWGVLPTSVFGPEADFIDAHRTELRKRLQAAGLTDAQRETWDIWLEAYDAHAPGSSMPKSLLGFIEKLVEARENLAAGAASFPVARKRQTFGPEMSKLLYRMLLAFLGREYAICIDRTRGLFRVLQSFEFAFDREARSAGRLLFQDLPLRIARGGADWQARVNWEYRLDGRYDHWLIDEFQDTATHQWAALRNLAEEAIQTADGSRSLYYVGDVKQAIYGWRQGDPRLFHLLRDHYSSIRMGPPLSVSWRSAPPVLDAVNAVFDPDRLREFDALPREVVNRWALDWAPHRAAPPARKLSGYVAHIALPRLTQERNDARNARILAVLGGLIESAAPGVRRAVLVRSNEMGAQVVDALRGRGLGAVSESAQTLADNPLVEAFLALVGLAEHPGDVQARQLVAMSPFGSWAAGQGWTVERLGLETLRAIRDEGISAVARDWRTRIPPDPADAFTAGRWAGLLDAARDFEAQGGGGMDVWARAARARETVEPADPDAVRVLTIHKAKGLEYDAVYLPELETQGLTSSGKIGLTLREELSLDRKVEWVLQYPRRMLAEGDPALREHLETLDAEAAYEALCVFYVAMTRAKRELTLLTVDPGESSRSRTPAALARAALCGADREEEIGGIRVTRRYSAGDEKWAATLPPRAQPHAATPAVLEPPPERKRLQRRLPSGSHPGQISAAQIFTGSAAAEFGTALHALFEQLEWSGAGAEDRAVAAWREFAVTPGGLREAVEAEFRHAMGSDGVRAALAKPPGEPALWRERRFEILLEDEWISGCFDRVTLRKDGTGKPASAEVLDYKSNDARTEEQIAEAAESYRSQLDLYRTCLSRMLGLDRAKISAVLVFTKPARAVQL